MISSPENNAQPPPRRPRLQFTLSTLLLATLVLATALGAFGGVGGVFAAAIAIACVEAIRGWVELVKRPAILVAAVLAVTLFLAGAVWEHEPVGIFLVVFVLLCVRAAQFCVTKPLPLQRIIVCAVVLVLAVGLLLPLNRPANPAVSQSTCGNNLSQLARGLRAYHSTYGCFPPAAVNDSHGKPMHSWRVLILPSVDAGMYYRTYHFHEPWNSPYNSDFLGRHPPPIFNCPADPGCPWESGTTSYVALTGPGTAWDRVAKGADPDSTGGVVLIEVANSGIAWLEPKDLSLDEALGRISPANGLGMSNAHGVGGLWETPCVRVAFADGSVASIPEGLPRVTLRKLLIEGNVQFARVEPPPAAAAELANGQRHRGVFCFGAPPAGARPDRRSPGGA